MYYKTDSCHTTVHVFSRYNANLLCEYNVSQRGVSADTDVAADTTAGDKLRYCNLYRVSD